MLLHNIHVVPKANNVLSILIKLSNWIRILLRIEFMDIIIHYFILIICLSLMKLNKAPSTRIALSDSIFKFSIVKKLIIENIKCEIIFHVF